MTGLARGKRGVGYWRAWRRVRLTVISHPGFVMRHRAIVLLLMVGAAGCASWRGGAATTDEAVATASATRSCGPGRDATDSPTLTGDALIARAQICAMMDRAANAWNRGDLETFVDDYLDSPQTTFIGSRGLVRGRAAIAATYAPRFAVGGTRDSLSFERLEVDLLADDVANVTAMYVLARGDSVTARGPTSLVMRRIGPRWRIVHDHSS